MADDAPVVLVHPRAQLAEGVVVLPVPDLGARLRVVGERLGEARVDPEAVFLPWFLDGHPDHRALGIALEQAGVRAEVELWGYETWTPLPANRLVDITKVFDRKERALAAYETAHLAFDVSSMLGLNRYRSAHASLGKGYVEGFLVAPAPRWFELAAEIGRP